MAIAFVQSAHGRGAATSVAVAFGGGVSAGSLLVVGVMFEDITTAILTVTDSLGNTYTQAGTIERAPVSGLGIQIFYAYNTAGGANTVTGTANAAQPINLMIHEYSGARTATDPLDATVVANGNGTDTPTTGTLATSVTGDLLFALEANNRSAVLAGAGYTRREDFAFNQFADTEDQIAGAAGNYSAVTAAMSSTGQWVISLAAFKPPAAGGAATPRLALLGVG